jgi:hypothetical protein
MIQGLDELDGGIFERTDGVGLRVGSNKVA